ncbi:MAG: S-layer homology domain-containing protein [Gloeotrichia echinulata DVL01]
MTNIPPTDPKSSGTTALGFDEFIAVLVAFTTIGAILFWSFSRRDEGWNLNLLSPPPSTPVESLQPNPAAGSVRNGEANADPNRKDSPTPITTPVTEPSTAPFATNLVTPAPVLPSTNVTPDDLQSKAPVAPAVKANQVQFSLVIPAKKKSTIPPPIAFNDVPNDFWGGRFINVLSSRGIIKGFPDYSFRPNQPVNRAEFAAILEQAFDKDLGKTAIEFKDVAAKFWATPVINKAIGSGFLSGYPDETFKPEQKITRVQVLVSLVTGLNLKAPGAADKVLNIYQDAKDIPKYATEKVAAATANGLVVNYPDPKVFAPNKEATRAEVAAMIHQALVRTGRLEAFPSQNIVRSPL